MITDLPNQNLKPLIDIAKRMDEVKFGTITMTFRVHQGLIVDITEQTFQRRRYNKLDNNNKTPDNNKKAT